MYLYFLNFRIYMLIGCKAFENVYDDSLNNQLQLKITQVFIYH